MKNIENLETEMGDRNRVELAAAQLAAIVQFSDDAIISKDLMGFVTTWNGGAEKLFGHTADEMVGHSILSLIPSNREQEEKQILDRIRKGENVPHFDTQRLRKNGSLVDISVTVSPIKDANGRIVGASKVARDITDRITAEAKIRELNRDLEQKVHERTDELARTLAMQRAILSSANYAIISTTAEGVVTTFNATAERWLGYTASEIVGKCTPALWHDAGEVAARAKVLTRSLGRPIEAGFETFAAKPRLGRIDETEWTLIRKDGSRFPATMSATQLIDANGVITGFLCILTDISQRKNTQKNLQAALKEVRDFKAAIDEHAIVATTDTTGRITYVNDKFCALSRYSREELLGQDHRIINSNFHSKSFMSDLWTTIGQGRVWKGEIRNKAKDGSFYWVDATLVPFMDENDKPRQYVAIRTDITERKRAENALRESEERFKKLSDATFEAICLSENGRFLDVNDQFLKMFGYKSHEVIGREILEIIAPESRTIVAEAIRAGREDTYENMVLAKDGGVRVVETRARMIRGGDRTIRMSALRDITETKKHALERENLIAELQAALSEVKTLSGLLPICAACKKIRDDKGYWSQVEVFVTQRTEAKFTHGVCPDCSEAFLAEAEKMTHSRIESKSGE